MRIKLPHLDTWNDRRSTVAAGYRRLLEPLTLDNCRQDLRLLSEQERTRPVYHLYVVRARERDALSQYLNAKGIATGLHYPVPLHQQPCYRSWGYQQASLPVTERVASEVLSLPMFPHLKTGEQLRIADAIAAFVQGRRRSAEPTPTGISAAP